MLPVADRRWRGGVAALVLLAAVQVARLVHGVMGPAVYDADFRQEYCLARALADGSRLYEALPVTVARYVGPAGTVLPTSPNHPPPAALLALPFALLRYETAARLWFLLQMAALAWTGWALARELDWTPAVGWLAVAAALVWPPVVLDLRFGNLNVVLLALLVGSWRAWRRGALVLAGVLLGVATALKLVPGYLVVLVLLRREWRAAVAAAAVCGGLALAVTLRAGPAIWTDFATSVGQSMSIYQAQCFNVSLFGTVHRWTHGVADVAPLVGGVGDGWLALAEAVVLTLPFVATARRVVPARHPVADLDWALWLTACTLATPLAWHFAFTLLLLPIAIVGRHAANGLPAWYAVALLGMAIPLEALTAAVGALAALTGPTAAGMVPGVAGLPYAVPTLSALVAFGAMLAARWRASAPLVPLATAPASA